MRSPSGKVSGELAIQSLGFRVKYGERSGTSAARHGYSHQVVPGPREFPKLIVVVGC